MRKIIILLLFVFVIGYCHRTPQIAGLPHRHEWELTRQANSPARDQCLSPRLAYYLQMDDGSELFLACLRGNRNE